MISNTQTIPIVLMVTSSLLACTMVGAIPDVESSNALGSLASSSSSPSQLFAHPFARLKELYQILSDRNRTESLIMNSLNTTNDYVANITKELEKNPILNMLYNTSKDSVKIGTSAATVVLNEGVAKPATFFVGQNLRLLGEGLNSLGHQLKYSGYHISNLESVIYNASQALSDYGVNLINSSMNNTQPIH